MEGKTARSSQSARAAGLLSFIDKAVSQGRPFVLDGGLGSELERRGFDISSELWSADLLINNPAALKTVHHAYLQAGARCITTASYQASVPGFKRLGFDVEKTRKLLLKSVDLAKQSIDEFQQQNPELDYRPLVAASIGPYGAAQADGSEYRGNYGLTAQQLTEFHESRLQWMDDSGADCLAIETIPDLLETEVLAGLLGETSTPAWVSFCCADGCHLHDGHRVQEAAEKMIAVDSVFAVGINCTAPHLINDLLSELRAVVDRQLLLVYPNSGADYDAQLKRWSGQESADEFCSLARQWFDHGAQMIGGCCRIGPEQIAALTKENPIW